MPLFPAIGEIVGISGYSMTILITKHFRAAHPLAAHLRKMTLFIVHTVLQCLRDFPME